MQNDNYSNEHEKPKLNVGGNDIFCMKIKITILVCISQNFEVVLLAFFLCEETKFLLGEKNYLLKMTAFRSDTKCPHISGGRYF